MAEPSAELVVDARCGTAKARCGRRPRKRLYWVDIPGPRAAPLVAPTGHAQLDRPTRCWPASRRAPTRRRLDRRHGKRPLLDRAAGRRHARSDAAGARSTHAAPGMRFNDGRCDRQGRFWAGTHGDGHGRRLARRARSTATTRPTRAVASSCDGLIVPNGLAFSPDGRTMYLSDSHPSVQTDLGLRLRHRHRHAVATAACSST